MSRKGIIIKIGDDRSILEKCLRVFFPEAGNVNKFLMGEGPSQNMEGDFKKRNDTLDFFDKGTSDERRWSYFKIDITERKKDLYFQMKENWGFQVGEKNISPDHWFFVSGKDFELIARCLLIKT